MGRKILLLVCLLMFGQFVQAGEWVPISSPEPAPAIIDVISSTLDETVLSVSIPGYYREEIVIDGQSYVVYTLEKGHNLMEKGCPTLPFEAVNIAISPRGSTSWTVENARSIFHDVENYLPSKGHFTRNIDPETVPYTFSKVYETDGPYPRELVEVSGPFILRNIRGVNLSLRPFQYNPVGKQMIVTSSFELRLTTSGDRGENVLTEEMLVPESLVFQNIYAQRFINYSHLAERYPAVGEIGTMLIITYDSFYNDMLPFYYWKLQKGIPTKMVNLSTVGSTATDVKNYIQNEYNTNGLTFVLLVGDSGQMPYPTGTSGNVVGQASDPSYMFLSGGDIYPDAFVSRFPAQTVTNVQTMVNRIINYEKTPQSAGTWYHKTFGVAGDDVGGSPSMADWERMELLRAVLETPAYNYTVFDQIYHSSASAAQVTTAVNNGRGLGNYIGHGSETAWGTTGFNVTNVYALTNTNMVPYIISVACLNGRFNYTSDCFGEAWQKAGTPAAPTGALAIYASSTNQSWVPPCDAQTEAMDLLVAETYHTVGALSVNGCMGGMDLWPGTEAEQLYQQWHIFGDCSSMLFTNTPTTMSVTHDGVLILGQNTYSVTVSGVEGALCALYNETSHVLYGANYTNSSGQTTITLDPVPASVMTLKLTVTAFNRMPFFADVDVIVPSGPWLKHDSHIINDSAGNNDGIINPGETVAMSVVLQNIGADPASGVSATLSTSSPYVTVTDNYAAYPDIPVSGTGQSIVNHYSFTVGGAAPEGHVIPFTLTWSASGGYSDVTQFNEYVCTVLTISNVAVSNISINSATVTWNTNVPADSLVMYGDSVPPTLQKSDSTQTTSHSVNLTGLTDCTTYAFAVSSASPSCYTQTDDNSGSYYSFTTQMYMTMFNDDMESGSANWTAASPWAITTESANSPTHSWSDSPSGNYANSANTALTSVAFDLSGTSQASLTFWHIYALESGYDYGYVEVSTNGSTWNNLETFNGTQATWTEENYDLSAYVGNPNVQVRFRLTSDSIVVYDGWHIDDVSIGYATPCVPVAEYSSHSFSDSCPTGGAGDADGNLDAGETITFYIDVRNAGSGDLTGVSAGLSSSTPGVSIVDGSAAYPDIPEGTSATSLAPHFTVYLADSMSCGTTVDFTLSIFTDQGDFVGYFSETVGVIIPGTFTLVSENFESSWGTYGDNPPAGWTILDYGDEATPTWNTNDWYRYSKGGTYGYVARVYYSPLENQDEWLITPAFDIPAGATEINLDYDHYFYVYSSGEYGYVDFRSNENPTWTTLTTYSSTTANMAHVTTSLLAYAGHTNCQIRFRYDSYNGWYWEVDNVIIAGSQAGNCNMTVCASGGTVEEVPSGTAGSNPAIVGRDGNNVVLSFDPATGASHYNAYRGDLDTLASTGTYSHNTRITEEVCPGSPDMAIVDIDAFDDASNYYYLITGNNASCEGSFGKNSAETPRENFYWPVNSCYGLCL